MKIVKTPKYTLIRSGCFRAMKEIPNESISCCVTSPPYFGLRDYGIEGQIGLEKTPSEYVAKLVLVFREVRRVLKKEGTLWLNLGDSYARSSGSEKIQSFGDSGDVGKYPKGSRKPPEGLKEKDLIGIPWLVAFALQKDGWYLRQDIIWSKPNPVPESVKDRCTKAHEYVFLLAKSKKYYYDSKSVQEASVTDVAESRNRRSVWQIPVKPFKGAHFATFPVELALPCVLAGCPEGGTVYDPFTGSGTTGVACLQSHRLFTGSELNKDYFRIARKRISKEGNALI